MPNLCATEMLFKICCALAGPWIRNNTGQALNDGVHIKLTYLVRDVFSLFSAHKKDEAVTYLKSSTTRSSLFK